MKCNKCGAILGRKNKGKPTKRCWNCYSQLWHRPTKFRFNLYDFIKNRMEITTGAGLQNTKKRFNLRRGEATAITQKLSKKDFEIIPVSSKRRG